MNSKQPSTLPGNPAPRSYWLPIVFALTVGGSGVLLALSLWPGVLEDSLFSVPFCFISLPLLAGWILLLGALALRDLLRGSSPTEATWRWGLWAAVVMGVTLFQLWAHAPQRFALLYWHTEFQPLADQAAAGDLSNENVVRHIGPYRIDEIGIGEGGGVYFRTHIGPDGIGPDQTSYGFAWKPGDVPTPFGSAHFHLRRLFGEWYVFSVSDDW